jgi:hypothetical protein
MATAFLQVTQDQIWFFETVDFASSKDNSEDKGKTDPVKPGKSDPITRYPEVQENSWYKIRNGAHDSYGQEKLITWLWPIPELRVLIASGQGSKVCLSVCHKALFGEEIECSRPVSTRISRH